MQLLSRRNVNIIRLSKIGSFKELLLELKRPIKLKKRKNLAN